MEDIFKQLVAERHKAEEGVIETPTEEVNPTEEPIVDPVVGDEVVETAVEPTEEPVVEEPKSEKLKVDYNQWLSDNESTIKTYLNEKDKDYSKIPSEQLAEMKIRKENPTFSDEDVKEELGEKYGIGLQKQSENIDDYSDVEDDEARELVKEAKLHNKNLVTLQRALKKDAPTFVKEFEDAKASISLPEFEIEAPKIEQVKQLTIEEQYEEIQKQAETYKNEQWIPELKKSLDSFESVKQQVEYEDNGNKVVLDVDYKLSEADKKELLEEYGDYVVTAKDQEKYQDLDGFLNDKAPAKILSKLLKTVAKESAAKARETFVKNDLLNYDDGVKRQAQPQGELSFAEKFLAASQKK